jgi:hypothetical protein
MEVLVLPPNLASITTEPVANTTTTTNVPMTSVANLFWDEVSLDAILSLEALSNFLYSSFYIVFYLSYFIDWLALWVFNALIYYVIYEKHRAFALSMQPVFTDLSELLIMSSVIILGFWLLMMSMPTSFITSTARGLI